MPPETDPKIRPLVDVLNGIAGASTIMSCEGHCSSSVSPFVEFDAPLHIAQSLAMCLRAAWLGKKLTYWWEIVGRFEADGDLRFQLKSPRLDRNRGFWSRFQDHVLKRHLIDHDLSALAEVISTLHQTRGDFTAVAAVDAAIQQATSRKAFAQQMKELCRGRPDTAAPFLAVPFDGGRQ